MSTARAGISATSTVASASTPRRGPVGLSQPVPRSSESALAGVGRPVQREVVERDREDDVDPAIAQGAEQWRGIWLIPHANKTTDAARAGPVGPMRQVGGERRALLRERRARSCLICARRRFLTAAGVSSLVTFDCFKWVITP